MENIKDIYIQMINNEPLFESFIKENKNCSTDELITKYNLNLEINKPKNIR